MGSRRIVKKRLLPLALLLTSSGAIIAQSTSGSMVGAVHDASGGVVPGVKVTLTNTGTSESRTAESDSNGAYQFLNLQPGVYSVSFEESGFKRKVLTSLQVEVQQTVREDATLDVGAVSETVEVTGQAALLQTEQTSLSQVVEGRTVQEMPLNGRNVMNLVALVPGVVPQGDTSGNPVGGANGSTTNITAWGNYQIGGGAANQSATNFDGSPLNVSYVNSVALVPTQDAVQEFRVATNSVSAEYGRFAGGVISFASKGGSNSLHGSVYEYFRNKGLNASNFFATTKPDFNQDQYGASLSGPIKRDKTFFLFTWEKFYVRVGVPTVTTVPTAAMKTGDFSAFLGATNGVTNPCDGTAEHTGAIYDPKTTKTVSGVTCRTAFPGNIIPTARLDSTAIPMANLFGLPTSSALTNNWSGNGTGGADTNQYNGRIDHALNDKQRLFGRYTYWNGATVPNDLFHNLATATQTIFTTHNGVLGDTWTINPTTVVDVRLSYLRFVTGNYPSHTGTDLSKFGPSFGALQNQVTFPQYPASQVTGYYLFNPVTTRNHNNIETLSVGVDKILGRHDLKFGGESRMIEWGYGQTNYSSGEFYFNNAFTALSPSSTTGSGQAFASMMLGNPYSGLIQEILIAKQQMWYHGLYLTDTFQMTPKLTLNMGVRWDYPGQFKEAHDSAAVFLPNTPDSLGSSVGLPLNGSASLVNTSTYPSRYIHPAKWNLFAPRVGLAYKYSNGGVVRAGLGISYLPSDAIFGNAPWTTAPNLATTNMDVSDDGGLTPSAVLSNPFPNGIVLPSRHITNAQLENLILGQTLVAPTPNTPYPYATQWNLAFQQQLPGNLAVEIGYAGSKGTHLPQNTYIKGFPYYELNQLADSYFSQGSALTAQVANPFYGKVPSTAGILTKPTIAAGQLLRPYSQFTGVNNTAQLGGTGIWHALETKAEMRMKGGGVLLATYTWSKSIGNADSQTSWLDGGSGMVQDYTNPKGERSIESFDVPHRATISYVLDIPYGRGRHFGGNISKLADTVAGGWGVNGTTVFQSGFPLAFLAQASVLNTTFGAGPTRPNIAQGCQKNPGGSAFSRVMAKAWFNTSTTACWSQPSTYQLGNESRVDGGIRNQGIANWDMAVTKNFSLTERFRLKFDTEFFNAFNRVQFGAPGTQVGTASTYGVITATRNQQRQIQMALRLTF